MRAVFERAECVELSPAAATVWLARFARIDRGEG